MKDKQLCEGILLGFAITHTMYLILFSILLYLGAFK
jgi:hypothetical protein